MNWVSVGLGAVSGVLAVGIATILVRNSKKNRFAYRIVLAIAFAVMYALSRHFVYPDLNAWYSSRQAESALLELPVYQAIKQYDPNTYQAVLAGLRRGLKNGADESQLIAQLRGHLAPVIEKRLPHSSDEAAAAFVAVIVTELSELKAHGGDMCFRFLFPKGAPSIDGRKYFTKKTQEADSAALVQVIKTSAERSTPIPPESEVMPTLQPAYDALTTRFGEDAQMLVEPYGAGVDKGKVCDMTIFLYSQLLQLPPDLQGKAFRFMLSQG
jgi:hypothetical protein